MIDWEKFEPFITPDKVRERLGSAQHENNNVSNMESDWLRKGREIDASSSTNKSSYFDELEERQKK